MDKVVLQKDIRIEKNFPVEWPSIVQVYLTNGQQFEKFVRFPKGDPENPLTWEELSAKFQSLAMRVLPEDALRSNCAFGERHEVVHGAS